MLQIEKKVCVSVCGLVFGEEGQGSFSSFSPRSRLALVQGETGKQYVMVAK
jgi:hypothetical protein